MINALIDLAQETGRWAVSQLGEMVAELKPDSSYVTQIDRQVEATLRARLAAMAPDAGFWGEESGNERADARDVWVVDPIDGTTNLVHGLPHWGISIGLLRDARPHLGVFHMPVLGETYWAEAGRGSFFNGQRLAPAAPRSAIRQEDAVSISSECFALLDVRGFTGRLRNFGSAAAHCAYTARGALCAHVTRDDKLHDLAATFCIALEAGCEIGYLSGAEVDLRPWLAGAGNTEPLIVAAPGVLPLLRERLVYIDDGQRIWSRSSP